MYLGKGDGTFQLPQIVPLSRGLSPVYLQAADLRGNGILDLVIAEFDTNTVGVLLGKGDGTFGFEQTYTLPQPPAAIVVDDFNRDHTPDIVAVMFTLNSDTLGVDYVASLAGDGTGKFGAPVITKNWGFYSSAWSITSGDVNNDGLADILITGPSTLDNSEVYLNAGDGTFTAGQMLAENGPFNALVDAKLSDLNEDGCVDAAIADLNGNVWVVFGDCSGNFSALQSVQMGDSNSAIRVVDANGDGHLDLLTSSIGAIDPFYGDVAGDTLSIALGDGHGNFSTGRNYVGTGQSYSLAVADFNGDHHPDVVTVGNDTDTTNIFLNDGSANFGFPQGLFVGIVGVGTINAPLSPPYFADLNHDGKPDVLLLDEGYSGEYFSAAMLNDGTGRFAPPIITDLGISIVGNWMGDYKLGDFRNTGNLDLVGVGLNGAYSTAASYILFAPGKGDGSFGASTLTSVTGASGAMAIGDFNGDGKLDFVAVSSGWVSSKQLTTFLGNGDGAFRTGATLSFNDSAQDLVRFFAGDFNHDGKLDVLLYDSGNGYWTTASYVWEFLGNGDGTFQAGRQLFSGFQPMTLADLNGDHGPDIVRYDFFWPDGTTETQGSAKFTNYLDHADGSFSQISSYAPYAGSPLTTGSYLQLGDPTVLSMASDHNGDGKPDEMAIQSPTTGNRVLYGQMLMGMGDGTFTPTYDFFTSYKPFGFPKYAHDLNGNGSADVLELDQSISSMHVFKSAPAPAIQIALEEEQLQSNTSCGWVFPNVPASSDRQVTLSSSVTGVSLPAAVTIPASALSQQFCYSLDNTYNWRQVFDVRAQLGSDVAVAYASAAYTFGFGETLAPNTQQVFYPTQNSTPITITLTSSQGYGSTVHLSCDSLPPGSSCQFAANTLVLTPSGTAHTTVVIKTTAAAQYGGTIFVVADDGRVAKRQPFTYVVQPLMLNLFGYLRGTPANSVTADLSVYGLPPYTPSCSGLPAGATCSFTGPQLDWPSTTDLATTVSIPPNTPAADYPFTIAVHSGSVVATASATLNVIDFAFQGPPSIDWIPPGGSIQTSLTLQPLNQFNLSVDIGCNLSAGGTCTGSTAYGGVIGSTLSVAVPTGTSPGNYTLTVTGTVGSLSHTAQFSFVVADYSGSLSTNAITIAGGGTQAVNAIVNATDGFAGTVSLSCVTSSPVVCRFSPQSLTPTGSSPATATVNITASYASRASTASHFGTLAVLLFPFGIVISCARRKRHAASIATLGLTLVILLTLSCGGNSSPGKGGGVHGSNTYSVQVVATANQTNTTRTLGTVQITVTH